MTTASSKILRKIGPVLALAIGVTSATAHATGTGAVTVQTIEYSGGTLLVQLAGGTNYFGQISGTPTPCANQTADTLKSWLTMTQAALLSGKKVQVYYSTCGSTNYISAIDLFQ